MGNIYKIKKISKHLSFLTVFLSIETWAVDITEAHFESYYKIAKKEHVPSSIQYLDRWQDFKDKLEGAHNNTKTPNSIFRYGEGTLYLDDRNVKPSEGHIQQAFIHAYLNLTFASYLQKRSDHLSSKTYLKFANEFLSEAFSEKLEDNSKLNATLIRWRERLLFQEKPAYLFFKYDLENLAHQALSDKEKALDYMHATRFLPETLWGDIQPERLAVFQKMTNEDDPYFQAELNAYYYDHFFKVCPSNTKAALQGQLKDLGYGWSFFEESHFFYPSTQSQLVLLNNLLERFLETPFNDSKLHSNTVKSIQKIINNDHLSEAYRLTIKQGYEEILSIPTLDVSYLKSGIMYRDGDAYQEIDLVKAKAFFKKAALLGNPEAQRSLGLIYYREDNEIKALEWLKKAESQEYEEAAFKIGLAYDKGYADVSVNEPKAIKFYKKAALQGHIQAQYNVGLIYFKKTNPSDEEKAKAFKWIEKAAFQEHQDAQCILGAMYNHGYHIAVNKTEASNWFEKAALQGDSDAQFELGVIYDTEGTAADKEKAIEWYTKSAVQGHEKAQFNLDLLHSEKGDAFFDEALK